MMSGGVDSSVAAALLRDQGHDVVGVTLKLWGGASDTGCCSISDVDDARRVADHLGLDHHTFNFGDEFTAHVVGPYSDAHAAGLTPNPCIECNRHIKFAAVHQRARVLGFDAVATGHHARVVSRPDGSRRIARGVDESKDQSYVLHMLDQERLAETLLPVGEMTKGDVRARAAQWGLRTAGKPDSQDVCFITRAQGRGDFLGRRIEFTPAPVIDTSGMPVGRVDAVELVTLGQRRGLGLAGGSAPRFVVDIDRSGDDPVVVVGSGSDLLVETQAVANWSWADPASAPPTGEPSPPLDVQISAHGRALPAQVTVDDGTVTVAWRSPQRRVAPGQSVVAYEGDQVAGGGLAL